MEKVKFAARTWWPQLAMLAAVAVAVFAAYMVSGTVEVASAQQAPGGSGKFSPEDMATSGAAAIGWLIILGTIGMLAYYLIKGSAMGAVTTVLLGGLFATFAFAPEMMLDFGRWLTQDILGLSDGGSGGSQL